MLSLIFCGRHNKPSGTIHYLFQHIWDTATSIQYIYTLTRTTVLLSSLSSGSHCLLNNENQLGRYTKPLGVCCFLSPFHPQANFSVFMEDDEILTDPLGHNQDKVRQPCISHFVCAYFHLNERVSGNRFVCERARSLPSESWRIWERAAQIVSADKLFRVQLLYPMTPLTEHKLFSKLPERQWCYTRKTWPPWAESRVCEATGGREGDGERENLIHIHPLHQLTDVLISHCH